MKQLKAIAITILVAIFTIEILSSYVSDKKSDQVKAQLDSLRNVISVTEQEIKSVMIRDSSLYMAEIPIDNGSDTIFVVTRKRHLLKMRQVLVVKK